MDFTDTRPSILVECAEAFASNMASVIRLRQIFDARAGEELSAFAGECTDELRGLLAGMGFAVPDAPASAPNVPEGGSVPASSVDATGEALDPAATPSDTAPTMAASDPVDVSALARVLAWFGIGR